MPSLPQIELFLIDAEVEIKFVVDSLYFAQQPATTTHGVCRVRVIFSCAGDERNILPRASVGENMLSATATKNTALGYDASGGRAMQGLVTPLELVVVPYLRRRAARPARARSAMIAFL